MGSIHPSRRCRWMVAWAVGLTAVFLCLGGWLARLQEEARRLERAEWAALLDPVAADPGLTVPSRAAVPGYKVTSLVAIEKPHSYKTARGQPGLAPGTKTTFSQARFGLFLERDGSGLFLKMFQSLFVAVAIALLPCFIRPTDVDPRFGLGVGALFAVVANAYLTGSYVPETSVFTLADVMNLLGIVTILVTLVQSTVSLHFFQGRDDPDLSRRFDRISFIVLLAGFVAATVLVLRSAVA